LSGAERSSAMTWIKGPVLSPLKLVHVVGECERRGGGGDPPPRRGLKAQEKLGRERWRHRSRG
jgi:hypothetical protein